MVISKAWKDLERYTAKSLSGVRIGRGADFSKSLPDVIACSEHSLLRTRGTILAECKYSARSPWVTYIKSIYEGKIIQIPIKDDILLFSILEDVRKFIDPEQLKTQIVSKKVPTYLKDNLEQARGYRLNLSTNKIHRVVMEDLLSIDQEQLFPMLPMVILGKKRDSTRVCYLSLCDLTEFYSQQSRSYDSSKSNINNISLWGNNSFTIRK